MTKTNMKGLIIRIYETKDVLTYQSHENNICPW